MNRQSHMFRRDVQCENNNFSKVIRITRDKLKRNFALENKFEILKYKINNEKIEFKTDCIVR